MNTIGLAHAGRGCAVLLCLAMLGAPATLYAATYYVSTGGNANWTQCTSGANPCSWRTAMANAQADDIVYFRGGTYDVSAYCVGDYETIAMSPVNSGSPGHYITFAAFPGETPVVAPCMTTRSALAFGARNSSYIIWDGFSGTMLPNASTSDEGWYFGFIGSTGSIVRNMDFSSGTVTSYHNHAPIRIMHSNYNEIYNNRFHDIAGNSSAANTAGVWLLDADYARIYNNTFENCRYGIQQKDGPNIGTEIFRNFFSSISADGIQLQEQFDGGGGLKIYQNVFVNVNGAAINLYDCTQTKNDYQIYNNTIYSAGRGIEVSGKARNNQVWNNILSGTSRPFQRYYTGADFPGYSDYNAYYGTGNWNLNYSTNYSSLSAWRNATGFEANSVTTDPGFVNGGAVDPAGYKRVAYPADGRGGGYASVKGAYITGTETIGQASVSGGAGITVSFAAAGSSGPEGTGTVSIPVSLSVASSSPVIVAYSVTGGSATGGGVDYSLTPETLTFSPGSVTKNVSFIVVNDVVTEAPETVVISLGSPTGATLGGNPTHTYSIVDDDSAITPTVLFSEKFDDTSLASRGWYDTTAFSRSTAEHVSGSTASAEFHFVAGATVPQVSGGALRKKFSENESLYVSYYVKHSANWVGSNRSYHPHMIYLMTNLDGDYWGPSTSHLTAYIEENSGKPVLAIQDALNIDQTRIGVDLTSVTEARAVAGCNGYSTADGSAAEDCYLSGSSYRNEKSWRPASDYFQDSPGTYYKGDWHHVEAYFQMNHVVGGVGVADGVVRYWFDGVLIIDHSNVLLRTAQNPAMKFNQFLLSPYIGDGSPVDQTIWIDDLTVATGRIYTGIFRAPMNLRIP